MNYAIFWVNFMNYPNFWVNFITSVDNISLCFLFLVPQQSEGFLKKIKKRESKCTLSNFNDENAQ